MILWWYRIHCLGWLPSLVTSSTDSGSQPSSDAISKWPLPIGGLDAFARHPVFRCRNCSDQISMAQNRIFQENHSRLWGYSLGILVLKLLKHVQHFDFGNDKKSGYVRLCFQQPGDLAVQVLELRNASSKGWKNIQERLLHHSQLQHVTTNKISCGYQPTVYVCFQTICPYMDTGTSISQKLGTPQIIQRGYTTIKTETS